MQNDCFPEAAPEWEKAPISALAEQNPRYPIKRGQEYPLIEMASVGENFRGVQSLDTRRMEGSGLSRFKVNDTLFAKITPCPENGKVAFVQSLPTEVGLGSTEFIVLSPIPIFEDQAAIARILDAVDTAIEAIRRSIGTGDDLRASLINNVVQRSRKTFPAAVLGAHIEDGPTNGLYRPESDYGAKGTPIVRIDSFSGGAIGGLESLRRVVVPSILRQRFALESREVLINRVNALTHVGKAAVVPCLTETTLFESNMMRLRCSPALLPEYLGLILRSDIARRHWLARAKPAVNQVSINQRDVKELTFPLPELDHQREAAQVVAAADALLVEQAKKIKALEACTTCSPVPCGSPIATSSRPREHPGTHRPAGPSAGRAVRGRMAGVQGQSLRAGRAG